MWKYILKARYWDKSGIPLRMFKPTTKSTMLNLTPLIKNALKDVGEMNLYIYRENLGDYDPDILFEIKSVEDFKNKISKLMSENSWKKLDNRHKFLIYTDDN